MTSQCALHYNNDMKDVGPGVVSLAPGPRAPEVRGEGAGFGPKILGRESK